MKKVFILSVLLFFSLQSSLALNPFIKNYNITQGLPTNKISQVYKDSKGFLWFGTDVGVLRFDGNNLVNFTIEDGLSDNLIMKIKEDSSGRIWFLNRNGTANYYYQNTIYNEKNAPFLKSIKSDFFLFDFYEDSDSSLYFYNSVSDVFVVKNNELIDYRNFGFNDRTFVGGLQYFNKSSDDNFLLWTSQGIFKIKHIDDSLKLDVQPFFNIKVFPASRFKSITLDLNGRLHLYNNNQLGRRNFTNSSTSLINSIIIDSEGLIWIATFDQGIFCYDNDKLLLHLDIIQAQNIIADNENNIWISSGVNGIYKVNRDILKYTFLDSENFYDRGIKALAISNDKNVLATNGSYLYIIHDKKPFPVNQKINSEILSNIFQLKNNTVYMNGPGSELFSIDNVHFDNKTESVLFGKYKEYSNFRIKNNIIANSSEDSLYAYINDDLLILFKYPDNRELKGEVVKINLGRINSLFYTNEGNLVINTPLNYSISTDTTPAVKFNVFNNNTLRPLNGKVISSHLKVDDNNELFNVQGNNIYLLNNKTFYDITKNIKSQIDYHIFDMAYSDSTLFFFTINTVYFISNPLRIIENKPLVLNRLNIEFNDINDIIVEDSTLYVASEDGLIFIPVEDCVKAEQEVLKPYIYKVLLDDEEYNFNRRIVEFKKRKRLSIEFASLNYSSFPSKYTYMLEGVDENWILASETRVVYSNLPPGNYTFKLQAKKSIEEKSGEIDLPITIYPTFFQRTAVKLFILLIFLSILIMVVRMIYISKIRKKETENTLISLEHKALQSMMNPHFIFNALGSIQRYLLQNKSEEAGTYLSQFARLIRQNMNSLRSNFISIDDEIERLRNYLELEKFRMNNKFSFNIELDDRIDGDETGIPSMIVQPFVENAIWHGISSLPEKGEIKVQFNYRDEKCIIIVIEDNGVGMDNTKFSSKSENNLNMSASITEKRLKLMGEQKHITTEIKYEELNHGMKYPGTRVILIVPVLT